MKNLLPKVCLEKDYLEQNVDAVATLFLKSTTLWGIENGFIKVPGIEIKKVEKSEEDEKNIRLAKIIRDSDFGCQQEDVYKLISEVVGADLEKIADDLPKNNDKIFSLAPGVSFLCKKKIDGGWGIPDIKPNDMIIHSGTTNELCALTHQGRRVHFTRNHIKDKEDKESIKFLTLDEIKETVRGILKSDKVGVIRSLYKIFQDAVARNVSAENIVTENSN